MATACSNIDILGFTTVFPGFKWPPFFVDYSLMLISIEKMVTEINLDIDRVIDFFT